MSQLHFRARTAQLEVNQRFCIHGGSKDKFHKQTTQRSIPYLVHSDPGYLDHFLQQGPYPYADKHRTTMCLGPIVKCVLKSLISFLQ